MDNVLSLNAGQLRDSIEFYTSNAIKDDSGGFPSSQKTLAFTMLCQSMPKGSTKSYEGNKTEYTEVWNILMRYEIGRVPDESMLAKFNSEWFLIKGIENVKNRNLVLKIILVKK